MTRRRGGRRGSLLPTLLVFALLAGYASMEAGTFWEAVLRREREDQLAWALVHLQRAVDEAQQKLGRAPTDLDEVAALRPPVLARVPLDPFTRRADWRLEPVVGGAPTVHSSTDVEAFDGTRCAAWRAERVSRTWRVVKGDPR